ncbi:MAG: hypothetical protein EZS28_006526 [Streblomastix strix]|uniref:non-specific serine/threonine protein kinase n=1 Tax=Streblomastix strix TaxID=222440 RepID=A0A5J4WTR3_9EUKA|nr:MAG: hypothetical protein EZS28_006526 [Streblomastix strix]
MDTPGGFIELEQINASRGRRIGIVYRVLNTRDCKLYAVRKIDAKKYNISEWQLNELIRTNKLENQHLVQNVFVFFKDGALHHVMELLEERTLLRRVPRAGFPQDNLPEERIWQYLRQIAEALSVMFDAKVFHLNLWPANIFIRGKEELLVGDFGLAYFWIGDDIEKHGEKNTIPYASPEVLANEQFGPSADIYSLGVIAYELCTGIQPYEYKDNELEKVNDEKKGVKRDKENKDSIQKNRREWFLNTIRNPDSLSKISAQFDSAPPVVAMKYSKGLKDLILSMLSHNRKERPSANLIIEKSQPQMPRRRMSFGAFYNQVTGKRGEIDDSSLQKEQDKGALKQLPNKSFTLRVGFNRKGVDFRNMFMGKDKQSTDLRQETKKTSTEENEEQLIVFQNQHTSKIGHSDKVMSEADFSKFFAVYNSSDKNNASETDRDQILQKFNISSHKKSKSFMLPETKSSAESSTISSQDKYAPQHSFQYQGLSQLYKNASGPQPNMPTLRQSRVNSDDSTQHKKELQKFAGQAQNNPNSSSTITSSQTPRGYKSSTLKPQTTLNPQQDTSSARKSSTLKPYSDNSYLKAPLTDRPRDQKEQPMKPIPLSSLSQTSKSQKPNNEQSIDTSKPQDQPKLPRTVSPQNTSASSKPISKSKSPLNTLKKSNIQNSLPDNSLNQVAPERQQYKSKSPMPQTTQQTSNHITPERQQYKSKSPMPQTTQQTTPTTSNHSTSPQPHTQQPTQLGLQTTSELTSKSLKPFSSTTLPQYSTRPQQSNEESTSPQPHTQQQQPQNSKSPQPSSQIHQRTAPTSQTPSIPYIKQLMEASKRSGTMRERTAQTDRSVPSRSTFASYSQATDKVEQSSHSHTKATDKSKGFTNFKNVSNFVNQLTKKDQHEMTKRWGGFASLMAQPYEYTTKYKQYLQYLDSQGCINIERVGDKTNYPQVPLRNVVGIFFAVSDDDEEVGATDEKIPSFNVNNAILVANLYLKRGYRVLYFFNPTPREFYKWLDWLLNTVEEDLTIYFSGGGAQLPDKTGREVDGKSEAMVMYDEITKLTEKGLDPVEEKKKFAKIDGIGPNYIMDYAMHELIMSKNYNRKGKGTSNLRINLISDCNHSGTQYNFDQEIEEKYRRGGDWGMPNVVHLGATLDEETNYNRECEDGVYYTIFCYAMIIFLENNPRATWHDLVKHETKLLPEDQHVQLTGTSPDLWNGYVIRPLLASEREIQLDELSDHKLKAGKKEGVSLESFSNLSETEMQNLRKRWDEFVIKEFKEQKREYKSQYKLRLQELDAMGCVPLKFIPREQLPQFRIFPKLAGVFMCPYENQTISLEDAPLNDGRAIIRILINNGYTVLYMVDPTSRQYYQWLDWLLNHADKELILYFNGHGGQTLEDFTGTEDDDKSEYYFTSKLDIENPEVKAVAKEIGRKQVETEDKKKQMQFISPIKGLHSWGVTDWCLNQILMNTRYPNTRIVLISDTCNSGTMFNLDTTSKSAVDISNVPNAIHIGAARDGTKAQQFGQEGEDMMGRLTREIFLMLEENKQATFTDLEKRVSEGEIGKVQNVQITYTNEGLKNQPILAQ